MDTPENLPPVEDSQRPLPIEEADRLALLEALVAYSYEGISMFDASANILYEHPANRRITGYAPDEMIGRNLFDFCHPEDTARVASRFARLVERPGESDGEVIRFRHRDGHWIYLEGMVVNQLHHPRLRGMVNTFRDVTHRVEMERQLKTAHLEAEANREIQQRFLANLSHELRTPLTLIKQPIEELTSGSSDPRADIAQRNLQRLESLVEELVDLTRLDAGTLELRVREWSITALLDDWLRQVGPLAENRAIQLRLKPAPADLRVFVDERKLAKAVLNLLSNAIKFAPANSVVEVEFKRKKVRSSNVPPCLRIEVHDRGEPIPKAVRARMFERFYRGESTGQSEPGMGLGLAIAHEMVELHGGDIGIQRRRGRNCFWIEVPLGVHHFAPHEIEMPKAANGELPPATSLDILPAELRPTPPQPAAHGERRHRLLLAEDNPDLRNYLAYHLEGIYALELVADGQSALEKVRHDPPDLLLSDVMMPGMDGLSLTTRLRERWSARQLCIVLLSARGTHHDRVAGLAAGADDYLAKPFSIQELLLRLHNLLDARGTKNAANMGGWGEKVRATVDAHLEDIGFGVIQLAELLGMSMRQLQRRFAEVFGTRPVTYLRERRLEHARSLLEAGNVATAAEAARRIAMTPAYFNRLFAATYGIPPARWLALRQTGLGVRRSPAVEANDPRG